MEVGDAHGRAASSGSHQRALFCDTTKNETIKAGHSTQSRVRSKVEHVLVVIKGIVGIDTVRVRALAKNPHRLEVTAASHAPKRNAPQRRTRTATPVSHTATSHSFPWSSTVSQSFRRVRAGSLTDLCRAASNPRVST